VSTSLSQPTPDSWKQEVNRRLAAHKSRKGPVAVQPAAPSLVRADVGSRAAQAAARVAARYAQAPSYSQMQAAEARVAVRAAAIATQVAIEAQAVAQEALANLEASREPQWEPQMASFTSSAVQERSRFIETTPESALTASAAAWVQDSYDRSSFDLRWEPDLPALPTEQSVSYTSRALDYEDAPQMDWWPAQETMPAVAIEAIEPAQPIPANLIEFPRELVATRKVRPRLAEAGQSETIEGQLSIFEVDPGAISTEPDSAQNMAAPVAARWTGIELDAQPLAETEEEAATARCSFTLQLAPMNRRLMSAVVDGALMTGVFLATALVAGNYMSQLPGVKQIEASAIAALMVIGVLYQAVFLALGGSTPGMRYAGISLCTFDDQSPSRARTMGRLCALLFSLAPLGLGVAWALFDEDHLSWHDRISKTYQRRG